MESTFKDSLDDIAESEKIKENEKKEEAAEMSRTSPEEQNIPLVNIKQEAEPSATSEDFINNIVDKSILKMKKAIGFKLTSQYDGAQLSSIFDVLKLIIHNEYHNLTPKSVNGDCQELLNEKLNDLKVAHSDVEKPDNLVSTESTNNEQQQQSISDNQLLNSTESKVEEEPEIAAEQSDQIASEAHLNIDVDDISTDDESLNSDEEETRPSLNNKVSKNEKEDVDLSKADSCDEKPTTSNKNETEKDKSEENLHVPDILKSLEGMSDSDSEDDMPVDDAESLPDENSNLEMADSLNDNSFHSETKENENEMSKEDNKLSPLNISDNINNAKDEDDDDLTTNSFKLELGQEEIDQICETIVTGDVAQESDDGAAASNSETEEDKDSSDKEEEENDEKNSNNDSSNPDDSDDDDPGKNLNKIDKFLKDLNKEFESDSDDEAKAKEDIKQEESEKEVTKSDSEKSDDEDISPIKSKKIKKRVLSLSSEDEEDSKNGKNNKKANISESSDEDDDDSQDSSKRRKRKRKRVRIDKSSDEEASESDSSGSSDSDKNRSRKKIKKILTPDRLNKETKNAERAESERRKRIEEKQMYYNQLVQGMEVQSSQVDEVILDFDKDTKEILVQVDKAFVKYLKPHQVDGIKFLYDCTIESIKRLEKDNNCGCILAHSMGLGKTFQIIAFLHTIMSNDHIRDTIKRVLVIVPYNVIKNWAMEFEKWFDECHVEKNIPIYEICDAKLNERVSYLKRWHENGGIMLITLNLFTNLIKPSNAKTKAAKKLNKSRATLTQCLLDPGSDMVIIDEGHLLKNDQGVFNRTVSQVKTLRRVILTGTPLQNNLSEYYTMVNFVKPQLLGTKNEFKNRFENPIKNGQHIDSTAHDVNVMKKRVHILHKLLKDCIHRCDYSVLVPYLQPKFEYVLNIRLTKTQRNMYKHYIEKLVDHSSGRYPTLFQDFTQLGYIWNHPALLHERQKRKKDEEEEDSNDSINDFIADDSDSSSSSSTVAKKLFDKSDDDSDIEVIYEKNSKTKNEDGDEKGDEQKPDVAIEENAPLALPNGWYEQYLPEDVYQIELSSKFVLLFNILEKCESIGDKILIFSQSLTNLDLIEYFLQEKMNEFNEKYGRDKSYEELTQMTGGISNRWIRNIDYFRIDGTVNSQNRTSIVEKFNDLDNHRARLMLVSIKAGGIGINLVGANRCIIFDVSWNPSIDLQAIFRIFRYGQSKPVYVYRFSAFGTMESKIYERQILKQSLSHRVVDEQNIQRHYKQSEIKEFYIFNGDTDEEPKLPNLPKDKVLADVFLDFKDAIMSYHEHDSLLENRPEESLTEEERKAAWNEYETEKQHGTYPQYNPYTLQQFNGAQPLLHNPTLSQQQMQQYFENLKLQRYLQSVGSNSFPNIYNPSTSQQRSLLAPPNNFHNGLSTQGIPLQTFQNGIMPTSSAAFQINNAVLNEREIENFIEKSHGINMMKIENEGFSVTANINLPIICLFENKNLDFFEKEFTKKFKSELVLNRVDKHKATNLMFNYLDKCMAIGKAYYSSMKALYIKHQQTSIKNPIFQKLNRANKALDTIHFEFVKTYKNHLVTQPLIPLSATTRQRKPNITNGQIEVIDLDVEE